MITHQEKQNKVLDLARRPLESIAEDVIDADREISELQDENECLRRELEQLQIAVRHMLNNTDYGIIQQRYVDTIYACLPEHRNER